MSISRDAAYEALLASYLSLLLAAFAGEDRDAIRARLEELRRALRLCEEAFPATVAANRTHLFWGLPFYE